MKLQLDNRSDNCIILSVSCAAERLNLLRCDAASSKEILELIGYDGKEIKLWRVKFVPFIYCADSHALTVFHGIACKH